MLRRTINKTVLLFFGRSLPLRLRSGFGRAIRYIFSGFSEENPEKDAAAIPNL